MKTVMNYSAIILLMIAFIVASTLTAQELNEPEYQEMTEIEYQLIQQKAQREIAEHGPTVEVSYEPNNIAADGDDCSNPIVIAVSPGMEAFNDMRQTTCGRGNNYSSTCMNNYDGGEDIIYQLVVSDVEDELELKFTIQAYYNYGGIAIMDACGNDCVCIKFVTLPDGVKEFNWLCTNGTYYIQVDTWPAPNCINFDLTIEPYIPPSPAETIISFPYFEGFADCEEWPINMLPFAGTEAHTVLSEDAGPGGTGDCCALLDGNTYSGFWYSSICGAAFDNNYPDHTAQIKMNYTPDDTPGSLQLDFDFRQSFSFNPNYSWFRVKVETLGETFILSENSGGQCFQYNSPWKDMIYDLSDYQTPGQNYELTLDFVGRYLYDYYNGGDAVMIDNVHLDFIQTGNSPPLALCQDVSVSADENCEGFVTAAMIDNGSSDPDGDPITLSLIPPGPYDLGATLVTLTVTDDSDESDDCTAIITVIDDTPPVIICPVDINTNNDVGQCDAVVNFLVTATDNCDNDVTIVCTQPSGSIFPVGTTVVSCTATDDADNTNSCSFNVIVSDNEAPVITPKPVEMEFVIWPPNHKYVTFGLSDFILSVDDNCTDVSVDDVKITKATSDEPEDAEGEGDGHTLDDIVIADVCKSIQLRKERQGGSNGRVYTIHLELVDDNGNQGSAVCQVQVPHNVGETAIDDGPVYEVLGNCNDKISFFATVNNENLRIYPNPFSTSTTFEYELSQPSTVQLIIYDYLGKQVELIEEKQTQGKQQIIWNAEGLQAGVYFCLVKTDQGTQTAKLVKL